VDVGDRLAAAACAYWRFGVRHQGTDEELGEVTGQVGPATDDPQHLNIWIDSSRPSGWRAFRYPEMTTLANAVRAGFPRCFSRRQGQCQIVVSWLFSAQPANQGLYNSEFEHDACGVATMRASAGHDTIDYALMALRVISGNVWTESAVAGRLLADWENTKDRFTLVLPRDYQRVLDVRASAESEGLDLNGPQVWERIMEASRG